MIFWNMSILKAPEALYASFYQREFLCQVKKLKSFSLIYLPNNCLICSINLEVAAEIEANCSSMLINIVGVPVTVTGIMLK